jgi:hypothetical protein
MDSSESRNAFSKSGDPYLTIEGSLEELRKMGFTHVTLRQVKNWSEWRHLPFFKFSKKMYIRRSALHEAFRKLQAEALDEVEATSHEGNARQRRR